MIPKFIIIYIREDIVAEDIVAEAIFDAILQYSVVYVRRLEPISKLYFKKRLCVT
jgi:hypothetical protein